MTEGSVQSVRAARVVLCRRCEPAHLLTAAPPAKGMGVTEARAMNPILIRKEP
jgi:hypothetical protein